MMSPMNRRPAATRGATLRAGLHLAAVLSLVAALGVVSPMMADAARAQSKATSTAHPQRRGRVNINTAALKDLEELPGIGTVMAQRIIAGRPYKSVADLEQAGVPPSTIRSLGGKLKAGRVPAAMREPAPGAAAPKPEQDREAAMAPARVAPQARKAAPQQTFFGIPIGWPAKPAPKEAAAPAAKEGSSERPEASARTAMTEHARAKEPPAKGMVWVDLDTRSYHVEGDRSYGATRHGKFMWEDQAIREGCRVSKAGPR